MPAHPATSPTDPARAPLGEAVFAACPNCETELRGPYCYACGQPTKGSIRHFGSILADVWGTLFDLDSRFFRSLIPLYFRPGFLTREYLAGRRVRYVTPFRLFFFLCISAFFVAQLSFAPEVRIERVGSEASAPAPAEKPSPGEQPDLLHSRLSIPWLPEFANHTVETTLWRARQRTREVADNPRLLINGALSALPQTMFLMIPLFALLLKITYIYQRRLYMEHLLIALHSHAFIFLSLLLLGLIHGLASLWPDGGLGLYLLSVTVMTWLLIYLLLMQKRVYGQGWILSAFNFTFIGTCYTVLLGFAIAWAVLWSLAFS